MHIHPKTNNIYAEIETWLADWQVDPCAGKVAFLSFYNWLKDQGSIEFDFKARPGISYSLRATDSAQKKRPLFVLIDVVDDDPLERWLSVCFYADMINDPEEKGDFVPQGLMNEDALCLNLEEEDAEMCAYIQQRLAEALAAAR